MNFVPIFTRERNTVTELKKSIKDVLHGYHSAILLCRLTGYRGTRALRFCIHHNGDLVSLLMWQSGQGIVLGSIFKGIGMLIMIMGITGKCLSDNLLKIGQVFMLRALDNAANLDIVSMVLKWNLVHCFLYLKSFQI